MKCNKLLPDISVLIKQKLTEKNMSQRMLAEIVGMNETYLTEILRGRRAKRGSKYFKSIFKVLDVDINELPSKIRDLIYKKIA